MTLGAEAQPHLVVPHGITAWDWIHVAVILAVTVVATQAARRGVMRAAAKGDRDRAWGRLVSRFLTYVIVVAGLVYALVALRVQIGPLLGALGIGGIALAFALQDTLQNFVAGVLLQARRPRPGSPSSVTRRCSSPCCSGTRATRGGPAATLP